MGKARVRVREAPDHVEDPIPIVADIKLEARIGPMVETDSKEAKGLDLHKYRYSHWLL